MKPLLKYHGAKTKIANQIVRMIPNHTHYAEPFCGSAAVLFAKPMSELETINDINQQLITTYRVFQDSGKTKLLLRKLKFTLNSRSEWVKSRTIFQDFKNYSDIDIAWSIIILFAQSFALAGSSWGYHLKGRNTRWHFYKNTLKEKVDRIKLIQIENLCALEFIKKHDTENTFFYCDPPYPETVQKHYSGFSLQDFNELCELLKTIKGKFILSCYIKDGMNIDKNWNLKIIEVTGAVKKVMEGEFRKKIQEVLFYNFDLENQQNAFNF
jgi:DNA adenine methylase